MKLKRMRHMKGGTFYPSNMLALLATLLVVIMSTIFIAAMLFVLKFNMDIKVLGNIVAEEETSGKLMATLLNSGEGEPIKELLAYRVAEGKDSSYDSRLKETASKVLSKLAVSKTGVKQAYRILLREGESEEILASEGVLPASPIVAEVPMKSGGNAAMLLLEISKGWNE